MNIRIFTLRFNPVIGGFDDAEVRTFLADKEVETIKDHAFVHQGVPFVTLIVAYRAMESENFVPTGKNRANIQEESWRKMVTPEHLPLFNSLREWRTAKSREEGVPPYFIATNQQLAAIVVAKPKSLAGLARIEGIGQGKLSKYGRNILEILGTPIDTITANNEEKSVPKVEDNHGPNTEG